MAWGGSLGSLDVAHPPPLLSIPSAKRPQQSCSYWMGQAASFILYDIQRHKPIRFITAAFHPNSPQQ